MGRGRGDVARPGENTGLSAAHSVANAFYHINDCFEESPLHGELTAFGTLVQLVLEEREPAFLDRILRFCTTVGLPTTFGELRLKNVADEALMKVAAAASRDRLIMSMAGAAKKGDVDGRFYDHIAIFNAMKAADAYARLSLARRLACCTAINHSALPKAG